MQIVNKTVFVGLMLTGLSGAALGHGWPVPPYVVEGLGTQGFAGVVGGADGTSDRVATSTPGSTGEQTEAGRSDAPSPRVSVTNRAPTPSSATASFGRSTATARPKTQKEPWRAHMNIAWTAAFPVPMDNGYAGHQGIDAGLRLATDAGGWTRDEDRPSLLLILDSANPDHVRALKQLELDPRFQVAAQLFNCFRADAATFGEPTDLIRLRAYDRSGLLVNEARGDRKIRGAFDLLEKAWTTAGGTSLAQLLPKAESLAEAKAQADHKISVCEHAVVCPDCGDERHDVREILAVLRRHRADYARALSALH